MIAVELSAGLLERIRAHARRTYPEECCGFLLSAAGEDDREVRRVLSAVEAPNASAGERRRRFVIPAEELKSVEEEAARSGSVVGGFYHSHPDHPARPSAFDQDHAWPWYAYLVLSVTAVDSAAGLGAFELDADSGTFHEVPMRVSVSELSSAPVGGG